MIKLTKSNKVLRLIVCTLTALFVSLSFMGCPSPYGTDLPDTDTEQTGTETGTGSTTTPTTVDAADYKDFYVLVNGYSDPEASYVKAENKTYSDKQKNAYATRAAFTGVNGGLDNLKEFIKQDIMKPGNCGIEEGNFIQNGYTDENGQYVYGVFEDSAFDTELQSLWASIDANYQTYNYIEIVWHEDHYNRDYKIRIVNIKM